MIVIWSGALVDIPDGWALCDGTNGTPDLKDRFVVGAHPGKAPGTTGGAISHVHPVLPHSHNFTGDGHVHGTDPHTHDFTGDGHSHVVIGASGIQGGLGKHPLTSTDPAVGTTDPTSPDTDEQSAVGTTGVKIVTLLAGSNLPPYYYLAYIIKL